MMSVGLINWPGHLQA